MFRLARNVVVVCRKRRETPAWSDGLVTQAKEELLDSMDMDSELRHGIQALAWNRIHFLNDKARPSQSKTI